MFEKAISEAQLAANRANAQKSTGPVSAEGKLRSRRNACRHYLTSQVIVMTDEDRIACVAFEKSFVADLKPAGALEQTLVHNIATGYWRLQRAEAIEENYLSIEAERREDSLQARNAQLQNAALHCLTFFDAPDKFVRLSLYEQRLHRKIEKDLKTLQALQAKRAAGEAAPVGPARVSAAAQSAAAESAAAPADSIASAENGFVLSTCPQPPAETENTPGIRPESPGREAGIPAAA
ncbi:MAG: hypothetical protein KGN84_14315 [Acidobacteriota bacterium]|nr:hypothetical protein [Acidobacteriota bacterium]